MARSARRNVLVNIWWEKEKKPGLGLVLCSKETNRRKVWPSNWNPASGFEGRILRERERAGPQWLWCVFRAQRLLLEVEDTFATCCHPFCMATFHTWPHRAQCEPRPLASRVTGDLCSSASFHAAAAFALIRAPSPCASSSRSPGILLNHLYFVPSVFPQFVIFPSYTQS